MYIVKKLNIFIFILFIAVSSCSHINYNVPNRNVRVYTGLEQFLLTRAHKYRKKKALLITNHSGVNYNLTQNLILLRKEEIIIKTLLAPEHGIYGHQEEYSQQTYFKDKSRNVIIYNMHKMSDLQIKKIIKKNDILIFDIQDMGMRCYTYISNLKRIMDIVNTTSKELIILDRPNPIAPIGIDGFSLDPKFKSKYISAFPAPLIYNMTIGEAALFYKGEYLKNINLTVVPMRNYNNNLYFSETSQPWIPPSPNLPSFKSAIIYSWVVLLEGVKISLGRGTANPFEYIGAPWIEPISLSKALNNMDFDSFRFRPIYFTPKYSHYKGKKCGGVQIFYTGGKFTASEISFKVMKYLYYTYPKFEWIKYREKYHIDFLAGSDLFRKSIIDDYEYDRLEDIIEESQEEFRWQRRSYKLY